MIGRDTKQHWALSCFSSDWSSDEVLRWRVGTWHIWMSLFYQFPSGAQSLTVTLWAVRRHAAANSRRPAVMTHTHCTEECCLKAGTNPQRSSSGQTEERSAVVLVQQQGSRSEVKDSSLYNSVILTSQLYTSWYCLTCEDVWLVFLLTDFLKYNDLTSHARFLNWSLSNVCFVY